MKTKLIQYVPHTACMLLCLFALWLMQPACKKIEPRPEGDTQLPSVVMLQPADSQSFSVNTKFLVVTLMQDYVSLDKYRYNLYWHNHPSNVSPNPAAPPLSVDVSGPINDADGNKLENVSFYIDIPDSVRKGFYTLDVYCFDKAGNSSTNSVLVRFKD
ncbi:MAG: DUF4625 domain-containing protein [Bacteroidota bacterium]